MAARNLLSGEVLIGRLDDRPTDRPFPASLLEGPEFDGELLPRLVLHGGHAKRPRTLAVEPGESRWRVVQGSDADLDLIRQAGYELIDGRAS